VDGAIARESAQNGSGNWRLRRASGAGRSSGRLLAHAAVHGFIGQAIGVFVFVTKSVRNLKPAQKGDAALGLIVEGTQIGRFDLVLALDLLDHQLGIGDHPQVRMALVERPLQAGQQAGILGDIVGFGAQKAGKLSQFIAFGVCHYGAKAGWAGVAACATIAMRGNPGDWLGGRRGGFVEQAGR